MMQVTGNNNSVNGEYRILSIQLSLDGLYFSIARDSRVTSLTAIEYFKQMSEAANVANALNSDIQLNKSYDKVNVVLEGAESVLIPDEMFDAAAPNDLLVVNGIVVADDDTVVVSPCMNGIRAIIKYSSAVIDSLKMRFPEINFWTPLLADLRTNANNIMVTINPKTVHLSYVHLGKPLYAETLSYASGEDLVYFISTLRKKFALDKKTPIYIGGVVALKYDKILKKSFQNCNTEVFASSAFADNCAASGTMFNTVIKLSRENN